MRKYVVEGRKWFDRINGNTYHSVTVTDVQTGKVVFHDPFTYGYGDQWRQTAYDGLVELKLVDAKDRFNHEKNRKRFIYVGGEYVNRKRDL